jgi:transposase
VPEQFTILRDLVLAYPDATLPDHADRLEATTGVRYSPSHLSRLLHRLDLPLKKSL